MADDLQRRLAAAAAAGLMAGLSPYLAACNGGPPPNDPSGVGADPVGPASTDDEPDETDLAAGDKGCCGPGTNACSGQGQCGTETHDCRGQNSCSGQGGCFAKDCPKEKSRFEKQKGEGAPEPGPEPAPEPAPEADPAGAGGASGEAGG